MRHPVMSAHRRGGMALACVGLLSVLLHALVDFPFQIMALQNMAVVVAGPVDIVCNILVEASSRPAKALMVC